MGKKRKTWRAVPVPPDKWRMPDRQEHKWMCDTMVARNALVAFGPAVRERLRPLYPGCWRDMRLIEALLDKLQRQMMETMPPRRREYYQRLAGEGVHRVDFPNPVRTRDWVLADADDLGALTEAAMTSQCAMCVMMGSEIKRCRMRSALLSLAPLKTADENDRFAECEYRRIASQLVKGEEVSI